MKRDLESLIEMIRNKYAMYIGEPSITRLSLFIFGYNFAVYDREGCRGYISKLAGFTNWLAETYCVDESLGWADILLDVTNNDELAFDLFWEKWNEFCLLSEEKK